MSYTENLQDNKLGRYLRRFCGMLVHFYSADEVREIAFDYDEIFRRKVSGGKSESAALAEMGTPFREVARITKEDERVNKIYGAFLRDVTMVVVLIALICSGVYLAVIGNYSGVSGIFLLLGFMIAAMILSWQVVRGKQLSELSGLPSIAGIDLSDKWKTLRWIYSVVISLLPALPLYIFFNYERVLIGQLGIPAERVGITINQILECIFLLALVGFLCSIVRTALVSVRDFMLTLNSLGVMFSMLYFQSFLHGMGDGIHLNRVFVCVIFLAVGWVGAVVFIVKQRRRKSM